MMKISKIPVYSDLAKRTNQNIFTVNMGHNKHAEILYNENKMNYFIVENNRLVDGKGFSTTNKIKFAASVANLVATLQKMGADAAELSEKFTDSVLQYVK